MRTTVLAMMLGTLVLSGCESRFNPVNWFGGRAPLVEGAATTANVPPLVPASGRVQVIERRVPIASITSLEVAPTSNGTLVTAAGLTAAPGYFNAELVPVSAAGSSTLVLEFRAEQPAEIKAATNANALRLTAAKFLSDEDLRGASSITVRAAQNALTRRR